jgi:glycosyltransferase involved in cell wall biosynthesis
MNILSIPVYYGLSKPSHGGQNRYFHLIQQLEKRGNHIIVLEPQEFFDVNDRKLATVYVYPNYRVFHRGWSLLKDLDIWFVSKLLRILQDEQVDLVAIEYPSGAFAVKIAALLTKTNVPIVYSPHNVESDFVREVIQQVAQFSQFERMLMLPYMTALEKLTAKYLADRIAAVSDEDKNRFCSNYGLDIDKVAVIPSGCELRNPLDQQAKDRFRAEMGLEADSIIVVFHGSYSHPPNRQAIEAIVNYIAPRFAHDESIQFVIYGSDVPRFRQGNVLSLGYVAELHSALSAADIALIPITSGGGTKLKVFDCMNAALPIVTTRKGVQGINLKADVHALVVERVDDMIIDALTYLVKDEHARRLIGTNARRLVEEHYNWERIGEKLDRLYREIIDSYTDARLRRKTNE